MLVALIIVGMTTNVQLQICIMLIYSTKDKPQTKEDSDTVRSLKSLTGAVTWQQLHTTKYSIKTSVSISTSLSASFYDNNKQKSNILIFVQNSDGDHYLDKAAQCMCLLSVTQHTFKLKACKDLGNFFLIVRNAFCVRYIKHIIEEKKWHIQNPQLFPSWPLF